MEFFPFLKKFLKKEVLIERRTLNISSVMFLYAVVLAALIQLFMQTAMVSHLQQKKLAPFFIWLVYIFTAIMSFQGVFAPEMEGGAVKTIIARKLSLRALYAAKFLVCSALSFLGFLFIVLLYALFSRIAPERIPEVCFSIFLISVGSSALGVLLSGVSSGFKASAVVLPFLWLALGAPFYTVSLELLYAAYLNSAGFNYWLFYEILFVLMYIVMGIVLSPFVIEGLGSRNEEGRH